MTLRISILLACLSLCFYVTEAMAESGEISRDFFDGREILAHVPARLPPLGQRALVIVLHGGLGNAQRIAEKRSETGLNLNAEADRHGFIVAYLNGTPVARRLGADRLGWNGGGCCGQPALNKIDDIGYIQNAARFLIDKYRIDPARIYGTGHSNGGIMVQRLMCETDLFAAIIPISGPLMNGAASCLATRGKRILAIQGAQDENVPINGGHGKGLSNADFLAAEASRQIFIRSGADYRLQIVEAAHRLDTIESAIQRTEGLSLPQKIVRFFELDQR